MAVRRIERPCGWAFAVGAPIVKTTFVPTTRRTWVDGEKVPATGGCVIALNHLSHVDPLLTALFLHDHGRLPRYLAKAGLFDVRGLGGFLRSAGQIPVERASAHAVGAYDAAVAAVRAGECVVVYPEGTLTRDPALWPMVGKTGAARIALATGCPLVPVGQWGAQDLLAPYGKRPHLLPRPHVRMKAGDPVDLSDLEGRPLTAAALADATERIMAAITELVADLRGEEPPHQRFRWGRDGAARSTDPAGSDPHEQEEQQ